MENCVFKKLYLEDNTPIRTHIAVEDDSIRLTFLQNETAWKSVVISENLNSFAIQHKLSLKIYIEKLIEYVKNDNSDVAFVMTDDEFIINRLLDNNLKVKYFMCKLEEVNYVEYVEQIMDTFYTEKVKYAEKLETTIKEKNEIETYKISCELQLKELIEKKRTDDEELFGRFILILNEKKRRIQHLTELLEAFKAGRPTVNPPVVVKSIKKKTNVKEQSSTVRKLETISDSETSESSSSNSNSADEYNSEGEKPSFIENKPSTSIQTLTFLDDDFAQSPELPKRVKRNTIESAKVIPSTSKLPENKTEDKICNTSKKDTSTIDFSTQQLLDML